MAASGPRCRGHLGPRYLHGDQPPRNTVLPTFSPTPPHTQVSGPRSRVHPTSPTSSPRLLTDVQGLDPRRSTHPPGLQRKSFPIPPHRGRSLAVTVVAAQHGINPKVPPISAALDPPSLGHRRPIPKTDQIFPNTTTSQHHL